MDAIDLQRVGEAIDRASQENYSGVIRIDVDGEKLFERCDGMADRKQSIANSPETRFACASVTKMLTAVRVLQLAEHGRLAVDDLVSKHLNDLPAALDPSATVRDFLDHTSGLGDYIDDDAELAFEDMPVANLRSPADFLPWLRTTPATELGRGHYFYSSTGYVLLGLMIEAITGESYYTQIDKHVLKPAGMNRSGFFEVDRLPEQCAIGYLDDGRVNTPHTPARGGPDGGVFCTAADLSSFFQTVHTTDWLSPDSKRLMFEDYRLGAEGEHTAYAAGQFHMLYHGLHWAGHTGGDPGVSAMVFRELKQDINLICLCNHGEGAFRARGGRSIEPSPGLTNKCFVGFSHEAGNAYVLDRHDACEDFGCGAGHRDVVGGFVPCKR